MPLVLLERVKPEALALHRRIRQDGLLIGESGPESKEHTLDGEQTGGASGRRAVVVDQKAGISSWVSVEIDRDDLPLSVLRGLCFQGHGQGRHVPTFWRTLRGVRD